MLHEHDCLCQDRLVSPVCSHWRCSSLLFSSGHCIVVFDPLSIASSSQVRLSCETMVGKDGTRPTIMATEVPNTHRAVIQHDQPICHMPSSCQAPCTATIVHLRRSAATVTRRPMPRGAGVFEFVYTRACTLLLLCTAQAECEHEHVCLDSRRNRHALLYVNQ